MVLRKQCIDMNLSLLSLTIEVIFFFDKASIKESNKIKMNAFKKINEEKLTFFLIYILTFKSSTLTSY